MANRDYKIKNSNIFFSINLDSKTHELFSLAFNNKREMFLSFPTDSTQLITTYEEGVSKKHRRYDHISYHSDGSIHITHKEENRRKKKHIFNAKNKSNIFDLKDDSVIPLSLHSFFLGKAYEEIASLDEKNKEILLERIDSEFPPIEMNKNKIEWQLDEPKDFSIILFVLGKNLDPRTLPTNNPITKLINSDYDQPIIYPWGNPDETNNPKLWAIFTTKTVKCPSGFKQMITDKLSNHDSKVWHLMSFGVCPPWEELRTMSNSD